MDCHSHEIHEINLSTNRDDFTVLVERPRTGSRALWRLCTRPPAVEATPGSHPARLDCP